jgi:hypothetical protein
MILFHPGSITSEQTLNCLHESGEKKIQTIVYQDMSTRQNISETENN